MVVHHLSVTEPYATLNLRLRLGKFLDAALVLLSLNRRIDYVA